MSAATSHGQQLESWAATLSFLTADVSSGIESMARRLDLVMADDAIPTSGSLEPNGYRGLSRRGDPARLLLSDWALADSEPDEFLRRLAAAELSYLELAFDEPRPPSQINVLLDAGPDQLGAPRLAHLAGLVVLERRARSKAVPIVVGVLGDTSRTWRTGSLPELFTIWLRARSSKPAMRSDIESWFDSLPDRGSTWLFGAPRLSAVGFQCSRFWARESDWGPNGATRLEAVVADRAITLELPDQSRSLRILRGDGLRRRQRTSIGEVQGGLRYPSFHGSVRRLLCRGDGDDELVVASIPQSPDETGGRPKQRRFPGPVIAASLIGQRTVALVATERGLRVIVIGKRLARVDTIDISPSDLDLDEASIEEICTRTLEPLFFSAGSVVVCLAGHWWSIAADNVVSPLDYVAGIASPSSDRPRFARPTRDGIDVDGHMIGPSAGDVRLLLGPNHSVAVETNPGEWAISGRPEAQIRVDPDATVFGLTWTQGEPALLVQSPGGHLLRLVRATGTRTLTKLSHDVATSVLHPTLPLAAIQRIDGSIDVVDLDGPALLSRIRVLQP